MKHEPLRVIHVSPSATGGGAERVAAAMYRGMARRGNDAWLAVGKAGGQSPTTVTIPQGPVSPLGRALEGALNRVDRLDDQMTPIRLVRRLLRFASAPRRYVDFYLGRENFHHPGTAKIPELTPGPPDLLHLHNLHGDYFDLRQLRQLSRRFPIAMTLHDEWTYTGHCALTMDSERWRTGCRSCPDLDIYPAIRRDATHANHRAKHKIYARSRLYVNAPSKWLLNRARESILANGTVDWRLIPNGVDLSVFRPGDQIDARRALGIPNDRLVILFAANQPRINMFKDFATAARAVRAVSDELDRPIRFVVLGDTGLPEPMKNGEIVYVPFQEQPRDVALYYQAADVYVHAANAEVAGLTIIEAMATGVPVVATAVGGISESVRSLDGAQGGWGGATQRIEAATGVLVAQGDAPGMASALVQLLRDDELRRKLGRNAADDAAERFDFERQLDATIGWYQEIIADHRSWSDALKG